MGTRPVLIAGAGIAGLALALALARRGICSRIIEARKDPPREGAGIQLGPNATRLLIELGLEASLAPYAVCPSAIVVSDGSTGRSLTRLPLGDWLAERHGAPYWVLHRGALHAALWAAAQQAPEIDIVEGATVTEVVDDGSGAGLRTSDHGEFGGQLLVGADGLWSRVRAHLEPTFELSYSGVAAARSLIPMDHVPGDFRALVTGVWLAPKLHVVHYPVNGGDTLAIVAIGPSTEASNGWNVAVENEGIQQRFSPMAGPVRDLLGRAASWRQWALFEPKRVVAMHQARTVLIGDAAHPVLPFLAQGGALAIEDAFELAEAVATAELTTGSSLQNSLAAFAIRRRRRAQSVQEASVENGRIYHMSGPQALARNLALTTLPGKVFMRRYDWLYGYRAARN